MTEETTQQPKYHYAPKYVIAAVVALLLIGLFGQYCCQTPNSDNVNTTETVTPIPTVADVSTSTPSPTSSLQPRKSIDHEEDIANRNLAIYDITAGPTNSYQEHRIDEPEVIEFKPEYLPDGTINYFNYNAEDFYYLSYCIAGESQGTSWKQQVYTGSVVLNRLHSKKYNFGKTIKDVCLDPGQYTCFKYKDNPETWKKPIEQDKAVAYYLCKYGSLLPHNVYFQMEEPYGDGWYEQVGNTYFSYKSE